MAAKWFNSLATNSSLSSYSQIFFSLIFVFIIHHLAIQIKVQLWLPHVKNVSYFFFSHLKIRHLSKMHLISFFFISKSEIDGSLDNLWQKLHFWPSSWYWHSLLSSPAKSPKCILAGCIVKKTPLFSITSEPVEVGLLFL